MRRYIYIFLSLSLAISGCGYSLGILLPPHINTIYIETFDNKTHERNIEVEIAERIKDRYNWDGNLKVVNSREEADSVLEGEIVDYIRQPSRYSDVDDRDVDEYKLVLVVNLKFKDLVKDEVMWTESNFTGEAYYVVSGTPASTETRIRANSETEALNFAAEDLAQNIVDRTIEGW
jgi:hypothetical protein